MDKTLAIGEILQISPNKPNKLFTCIQFILTFVIFRYIRSSAKVCVPPASRLIDVLFSYHAAVPCRRRRIQSSPYLMLKKLPDDGKPLVGNERFQGFAAELARKIAEEVGFSYELRLVADGKYGAKMNDGNWNGMVGELTRRVRSSTFFSCKSTLWLR